MNTETLKRKAKGAIAVGAVGFGITQLQDKVIANPAIPLIPKIGIGVPFVVGSAFVLTYGVPTLIKDEADNRTKISGETKKVIKDKHVKYEVVNVVNVFEELEEGKDA